MPATALPSTQIRAAISRRLETLRDQTQPSAFAIALNIFFDLALEYESMRDFKSLCVLIPDACLSVPASLFQKGRQGAFQLRRTTVPHKPRLTVFPEPSCFQLDVPVRRDGLTAFPIREKESSRHEFLGILCLHRTLNRDEEKFFADYASRVAKVMQIKQTAISNRQRLTFINTLVRDIGHNVIVPNMQFKLLFMQMEKQIQTIAEQINRLAPIRTGTPDRAVRLQLPHDVQELKSQLNVIAKRFQLSSLFLESLLRRSHFEKGNYDLLLRPCKFKSQIFEPQIDRFRPLLKSQGVAIMIHPDVRIDEDIVFEADLGLMSQVFANLLSNAVKYTQSVSSPSEGTSKKMIYGWKSLPKAFGPESHGIRLFISTTGQPIPPGDAPRLFEADFRCAAEGAQEGSGHGLFFVKQIIELHKGRVGYEYSNNFNTFHITLPVVQYPAHNQEIASCPSQS